MAVLHVRGREEAQDSLRFHLLRAVCLRPPSHPVPVPCLTYEMPDINHALLRPLGPAGRHMPSFQSQKRGLRREREPLDRDAMPMREQAVCPIRRSIPRVRLSGRRHVKGPTSVLQHGVWRTWADHWLSMDRLVSETRPAASTSPAALGRTLEAACGVTPG